MHASIAKGGYFSIFMAFVDTLRQLKNGGLPKGAIQLDAE